MNALPGTFDELVARARALEPTASEIDTVLARVTATRARRWPAARRRSVVAFAAISLLVATAPVTGSALAGVFDSFFGSKIPDHPVIGQSLPGAKLPRWLKGATNRGLVVAGTGDHRLIAYREHSTGDYCFAYGSSVGECAGGGFWAKELADKLVILRGPTGAPGTTGALYGFTRGDVATVRLTFATHPPVKANAHNGGFVIETNTNWRPERLQLLEADGHQIAQITVTDSARP